nr:ROK family transcriptional regulator [Demequina litorisediminis]
MATTRDGSGSQSSLRRANTERIVDVVRQFGSLTQVELAQATGLSPATVSTIVKDLQAEGVVETRHTIRSGRRAQLVTLAHRAGLLVGVVVGERSLRIAIADSGYDILTRQDLPLPADHRHDTTLDRAALLIADLVESLGSTLDEVLAIGIAVPAPVDPATGSVPVSGILRGWEDLPIAEVLGRRLGAPAVVGNDADLGALGEPPVRSGPGTREPPVRARLLRSRRGHHPWRAGPPRAPGHGGRDWPHAARQPGSHLPLREPRLPQHGLRGSGAHRLASPFARPRHPHRRPRPRHRGGSRLPAGPLRRGHGHRHRRREHRSRPQPGGSLSWAESCRERAPSCSTRCGTPSASASHCSSPFRSNSSPPRLGDEAEVRGAFALASAHAHVTTGERVA